MHLNLTEDSSDVAAVDTFSEPPVHLHNVQALACITIPPMLTMRNECYMRTDVQHRLQQTECKHCRMITFRCVHDKKMTPTQRIKHHLKNLTHHCMNANVYIHL